MEGGKSGQYFSLLHCLEIPLFRENNLTPPAPRTSPFHIVEKGKNE